MTTETPEPHQHAAWGRWLVEKIGQDNATAIATLINADRDIDERTRKIIQMAQDAHNTEGEVEVDDNAVLSEGSDNGTYVAAWVWVSFADTEFDKDKVAEDA